MRGMKFDRVAYEYCLNCEKVIAVAECNVGNAETGCSKIEAKSFGKDTPVSKILEWAEDVGVSGRVIVVPDMGTENKEGK